MSQLYIRHCLLMVFMAVSFTCFGQFYSYKNEQPLLKHLAKEKLYTERIYLLTQLHDSAFQTSINLEKAWTYHAVNEISLSLQQYEELSFDSIVRYGFSNNYLSVLFKHYELKKIGELIKNPLLLNNNANSLESIALSVDLMELRVLPDKIQTLSLPDPLKDAYSRSTVLQRKSLVLSGLYSAILPGLGKAYYGKKKEAWGAFAANLLFGTQAFESYRKAGVKSFRFIFFGTGFSMFYLSNIYGSVAGLLKARRDWKKQLHHEVCETYFTTTHRLHPLYD
jgi:hypothetical protein